MAKVIIESGQSASGFRAVSSDTALFMPKHAIKAAGGRFYVYDKT